MSLKAEARKLGQMLATNRGVLHQLAFAVVRAAADGEIEPEDAYDIYTEYYKAAHHIAKVEADMPGLRQNVSKLRQLIKLGHQWRKDAIGLLRRAERAYEEAVRGNARVVGVYTHMVDVARAQLASAKPLSDPQLMQLALKRGRSR
jgi:hypothetical protein